MRHLKQYAKLESLSARLLIVGAHIPAIAVMMALHFLEGIVRAFHELYVQMSVSLSNTVQAFTNHNVEGMTAIVKDVVETVRGPAKPEGTYTPRLGPVDEYLINSRVAPRKWW